MKKQVKIIVKSVCGKCVVYPANELAESFTKLTGQKTFSHQQLIIISEMGYKIVQSATRA